MRDNPGAQINLVGDGQGGLQMVLCVGFVAAL